MCFTIFFFFAAIFLVFEGSNGYFFGTIRTKTYSCFWVGSQTSSLTLTAVLRCGNARFTYFLVFWLVKVGVTAIFLAF